MHTHTHTQSPPQQSLSWATTPSRPPSSQLTGFIRQSLTAVSATHVCPLSSGHNLANLLVHYGDLHVHVSCSLPLKLTVRGAGGCVGKKPCKFKDNEKLNSMHMRLPGMCQKKEKQNWFLSILSFLLIFEWLLHPPCLNSSFNKSLWQTI